ncbi:MAG: hypothetical protein LBR81_02740 [Prevotellaceae bacterium]|jgi:hypothetical protein|nr:hypothetical protein [Prevotellaceae bacterium]
MKNFRLLALVALLGLSGQMQAQQQIPNKQEFLNFWTKFKSALKSNDADFLFSHTTIPFDAQGLYFNTEADFEDVKENHAMIYPIYRREMEFVRFDAIMIEGEYSYIWLGYDTENDLFFYCYKHLSPTGDLKTYEEKYWFVKDGDTFRFFQTTLGVE